MTDLWTSKLSEYLDGTLSAADRTAVEAHLDECPECPAVLAELRRVVQDAGTLSDTPPATDLWSGIATRIRDTGPEVVDLGAERDQRRGRWRGRVSMTVPQLAAAGIVLAVVSGAIAGALVRPAATDPSIGGTAVLTPVAASGSDVALDQALSDLQEILEVGRTALDTTTVQILERNLAVIDRALEQAQQAIAADPANSYLREHLERTKRRKLSLMRRAADLVEIAS